MILVEQVLVGARLSCCILTKN